MLINDALVAAAERCLARSLEPIERFILQASWQGQPYNVIAETSGYTNAYVREIGAKLWQSLSDALGQKVTKKTLSLVMGTSESDRRWQLAYPSGPLPTNSPLYVERPELARPAIAALLQPGGLLRIHGPARMGKTSLLFRLLEQAEAQGYCIVIVQIRQVDPERLTSPNDFLGWFWGAIQAQLPRAIGLENLGPPTLAFLEREASRTTDPAGPASGAKLQVSRSLQQVLADSAAPLVLVLRDLDRLDDAPTVKTELLSLLQAWHDNARSLAPWTQLRLVVTYASKFAFLAGAQGSPFNAGVEIQLGPFSLDEATQLAQCYGLPEPVLSQLPQLFELLGGHPFLLAIAFYHLRVFPQPLTQLLETASVPGGIFGDHLQQHFNQLQNHPELAAALYQVVLADGPTAIDSRLAGRLHSLGLVQFQRDRVLPSCRLYHQYFAQQLAEVLRLQPEDSQCATQANQLELLIDRQFFEPWVQQVWNQIQRERSSLGLLLCGFDHYDRYVKTWGSVQAEARLRQLAQLLHEQLAASLGSELQGRSLSLGPVVAFYSQTQFIAVLPGCNPDQARDYAEYFCRQVAAQQIPFEFDASGVPTQRVTVSIGIVAKAAQAELTLTSLLTAAEEALHRAQAHA